MIQFVKSITFNFRQVVRGRGKMSLIVDKKWSCQIVDKKWVLNLTQPKAEEREIEKVIFQTTTEFYNSFNISSYVLEKMIESRKEDLPWPQPSESQSAILSAMNLELSPNMFMMGSGLGNRSVRQGVMSIPKLNKTHDYINSVDTRNLDLAQKFHNLRLHGPEASRNPLFSITPPQVKNPLKQLSPELKSKNISTNHARLTGDNNRFLNGMNDLSSSVPARRHQPVLEKASSEEVCTLYANQAVLPSIPTFPVAVGGRTMTRPPIGVFWDIENCSVSKAN